MITKAKNLKGSKSAKSTGSTEPAEQGTPGIDFCLTPNCKSEVYSRGLCEACRRSASRIICLGKADEAQLMDAGLMLPKQSGRPTGLFYTAFLAKVRGAKK